MTSDDDPQYEVLSQGKDAPPSQGDQPGASAFASVSAPPVRRRPSGRAIGVGSLALALLAGGAVFATARSGGGGEEPESVLPHTAFAFAKVDLHPGGAQSDALTSFVSRFPTAGAKTADEFRARAVGALTKAWHLDYTKDVAPWLGRRAAIAGFPGVDGRPQYVAALQVTDAAAARATLARVSDPPAVAERSGYVVIAKDQPTLDAALAAATAVPLSKNGAFASDLGKLAGAQIAVAWADNSGTADALLYGIEHPAAGAQIQGMDPYVKSVRAVAVGRTVIGLHANGSYAEILGYTVGQPRPAAAGNLARMRTLPDKSIGAAFVADAGSVLTGSGSPLAGFGIAGQIAPFSFGGLSLLFGGFGGGYTDYSSGSSVSASACAIPSPAPGETLSPDACMPLPASSASPASLPPAPAVSLAPAPAAPALGDKNVAPLPTNTEPPAYEDPMAPLFKELAGLLTDGATISLGSLPLPGAKDAPSAAVIAAVKDPAAATAVAAKVTGKLSEQYSNKWHTDVTGGELTVASDDKYAATLSTGGLGKTDLFKLAMGDPGEQVELAVFVNLEGVRDIVPGYPKQWLPVSAIGISSTRVGGDTMLRVRLVSR